MNTQPTPFTERGTVAATAPPWIVEPRSHAYYEILNNTDKIARNVTIECFDPTELGAATLTRVQVVFPSSSAMAAYFRSERIHQTRVVIRWHTDGGHRRHDADLGSPTWAWPGTPPPAGRDSQ